ncbi:MAG TPA: ATP-binding protein [Thermoanaerobaculia bacterium]|nr:ATP-binding protein [Thermoanaerobaculia bacterium]
MRRQEWLEVILESIGDAVLVTDDSRRVIFMNPAAVKITGWSPEESYGRPIEDIFNILYECTGEPVKSPVDRVLEKGTVVRLGSRTILVTRQGAEVPIDDSGAPIRNERGEITGVVLVFRDITQRRKAERALEKMEEGQRFLAEAARVLASSLDEREVLASVAHLSVPRIADWCGVYLLEEDGSIVRVALVHHDPSRVEILHEGLPIDPELLHMAPRVIRTGQPELVTEIDEAFLREISVDEQSFERCREMGLTSTMSVPLVARGRMLGAVTLSTDRSGRCYGPEDLEIALDFARNVALVLDNSRLYHEILETDRRKDEFLAMLAHELRNPLSPILNALEILRLRGEDPAARERALTLARRQARHMARLVDDLLDVSRITRGKIELRKERVELGALVAHAVESSRSLLEIRGHELAVSLPDEPVWMEADPARLEQVLANLLNNSAKYTDPGGKVWVHVERPGISEAVIRVKDTGAGIPRDMLGKVFDLFSQVDRSLDRSQGGLGIGLTLVRSLVSLHGGSVRAVSEGPGLGSELVVRLPVLPAASEEREKAPARATGDRRRRILVVEDNVDSAAALFELLRLWGHEVRVALDGPAAVEVTARDPQEIVLLDIGLPGMDGYRVAEAMRAQRGMEEARIAALTGYGQETDQQRSRDAGIDRHFTKPLDVAVLREFLAEG